ncbi:hypothetical protein HDU83_005634 [Entophlyctis luteolus]|nr:hypothetical protein HDU83_005634 [Entophlyctis luteolus]
MLGAAHTPTSFYRHILRRNSENADNDSAGSLLGTSSKPPALRSLAQIEKFKDGNMWQATVEGNLANLQKYACETEPGRGQRGSWERGVEGETILHVAVLFSQLEIVKWIVKEFPNLVNEVYTEEKYRGETALHIAVVNAGDDFRIVRCLVEAGAEVNWHLARGLEFQNNKMGCLYHGQTILQFAAANQKNGEEIIKYLVNAGADLTAVDEYGNNILHVMMYHGNFNLSFFKYLKDKNARDHKNRDSHIDITKARNKQNLTCFQVGISRGHVIALDAMKDVVWEFGMFREYKVLLDDLDPLQPHSVANGKLERNSISGIELAVRSRDKDILSHPLMKSILKIKWVLYGRKFFMFGFAMASILMVFLTIAISLQPSTLDQRRHYSLSDPYSICRFVFEVLTVICTLLVLYAEVKKIREKENYFKGNGAAENLRKLVLSLLIWCIPILRWVVAAIIPSYFASIRDCENIVFGIASIWGWIGLLEFAKGFENTGPLVLVFARMVFDDFLTWMSLYSVLTVGFASCLFLQMQYVPFLTTANAVPSYDWDQLAGAIMWTCRYIFMQASFDDFRYSRLPALTEFLYIIYGFVVLILLLNVLIAMLAETFKVIATNSKRHWRMQFAELLLGIDQGLIPRHRKFILRHLGWREKPISETTDDLTESRYFVFTERDVLKMDPVTRKKVKTQQTLKFAIARMRGKDGKLERLEIDCNKGHWDSWFSDLRVAISNGDEIPTSWWNPRSGAGADAEETPYQKIARAMRVEALSSMGVEYLSD